MGFKVSYTNGGNGRSNDLITGVKDKGRAEEHAKAYRGRIPQGSKDSVQVEKDGQQRKGRKG